MLVGLIGAELEENLAIRYIAASLARAGLSTTIIDFHTTSQIAAICDEISKMEPQVVGLSMVFTHRCRDYFELVRQLRMHGYLGHITAGGHFATFHAEQILHDHPGFDSIIIGEGEAPMVELVEHLAEFFTDGGEKSPISQWFLALTGISSDGIRAESGHGESKICKKTQRGHGLTPCREWENRPDFSTGSGETSHDFERARTDLSRVSGLVYRGASGEIQRTEPRAPLDDLDRLAPPLRPASFHEYMGLRIANMLSSRGCFANCHFCSINAWHRHNGARRHRRRDMALVAAEIASLYHEHHVRLFNFHDDSFLLPDERHNLARLSRLRDALHQHSVGQIGLQIKARPDCLTRETVQLLSKLGVFRYFIGIETDATAGLANLGRGLSREHNHEALRLIREAGQHASFNLLLFDPWCTLATIRANIEFIRMQSVFPLNFGRVEVYSGTEIERRLRAEGRLAGTYTSYDYTIADERGQAAYEMYRAIFPPRNFAAVGLAHEAMRLDYHLQLLKHFHSGASSPTLERDVKAVVSRLNEHSATLMSRVVRFVEAHGPTDGARRGLATADLSEERGKFDAGLRPELDELLGKIKALSRRRGSGREVSRVAASLAAAAFVVSSGVGITPPHTSIVLADEPQVEETIENIETIEVRPPPGHEYVVPFPADIEAKITTFIDTQYVDDLYRLGDRFLDRQAQQYAVWIEVGDSGWVTYVEPRVTSDPDFDRYLGDLISRWSFPFLEQGGGGWINVTLWRSFSPRFVDSLEHNTRANLGRLSILSREWPNYTGRVYTVFLAVEDGQRVRHAFVKEPLPEELEQAIIGFVRDASIDRYTAGYLPFPLWRIVTEDEQAQIQQYVEQTYAEPLNEKLEAVIEESESECHILPYVVIDGSGQVIMVESSLPIDRKSRAIVLEEIEQWTFPFVTETGFAIITLKAPCENKDYHMCEFLHFQ